MSMALLAGLADYMAGPQLSLQVLYLIPVLIAAWFGGRGPALAISAEVAIISVIADLPSHVVTPYPIVVLWNALALFAQYLLISWLVIELARAHMFQRGVSLTDNITGACNLRGFSQHVMREMERTDRYRRTFSVAYFHLEQFDLLAENLGPDLCDAALRQIADTIRNSTRLIDCVARVHRDGFAILLSETDKVSGRKAVENVHDALRELVQSQGWPTGFSVGLVTCLTSPESVDKLLRQAELLARRARETGSNRVHQETFAEIASVP